MFLLNTVIPDNEFSFISLLFESVVSLYLSVSVTATKYFSEISIKKRKRRESDITREEERKGERDRETKAEAEREAERHRGKE